MRCKEAKMLYQPLQSWTILSNSNCDCPAEGPGSGSEYCIEGNGAPQAEIVKAWMEKNLHGFAKYGTSEPNDSECKWFKN